MQPREAPRSAADRRSRRLVERFQAGEPQALAELYDLFAPEVYSYAHLALGQHAEAEDAVQHVFERLLRGLPEFRFHEGRPFRAWLFVVARNVVRDEVRRRGRTVPIDPNAIDEHLAEADRQRAAAMLPRLPDSDLAVLVRGLPLAQREVVVLRNILDLPFDQIADIVGKSTEATRKSHTRAIAELERRLASTSRRATRRAPRARMRMRYKPARVIVSRRFALWR